MKKVAVTGDPASGKSTFCQYWQRRGAYSVDADSIVYQLFETPLIYSKLVALFGREHVTRQEIAEAAWSQPECLQSIEAIFHPSVYSIIDKEYEYAQCHGFLLFVAEVPLLFETGKEGSFDYIVLITASSTLCRQRSRYLETYDQRKQRFYNNADKLSRVDCVVFNEGSLEELEHKANIILNHLVTK